MTIVTGLGPAEKGNSGVEEGAWTTPAEAALGVRCTEEVVLIVLSVLGLRCSWDESEFELGCR